MPSPDLGLAGKDTSKSCIFDFPDRPVRPVPPTDGGGNPLPLYPYDPIDDWPLIPPDPPVPGVDPIPGSVPHPPVPDSTPPGGVLSLLFLPYTAIDNNGIESRPLWTTSGFTWPVHLDLGWNVFNFSKGLVQAVNEHTPRDTMDAILQAEWGHNTLDNNVISGLVLYQKVFADATLLTYLLYYANYFPPGATDQKISLGPAASAGGVNSLPNLEFNNASPFITINQVNMTFWQANSNASGGFPMHVNISKNINVGKIFTDETVGFTVDLV